MANTCAFDPVAEQAVLGSCLLNPIASVDLLNQNKVTEDYFFDSTHRLIYRAIMKIVKDKGVMAVDLVSLHAQLKESHGLLAIGPERIDKLIDQTPSAAHCGHYIEIIHKHWITRASEELFKHAQNMLTDGKDAHDVLMTVTQTASQMLDRKSKIIDVNEVHENIKEDLANAKAGKVVGCPSKISTLQHILASYKPPDNVIVAARPSNGKTAFALNEVLNIGKSGVPAGIISLEMSHKQLRMRLAGMHARLNLFRMQQGDFSSDEMERLSESLNAIAKMPIYIVDGRMSIGEIESVGTRLRAQYGIELLVGDYLQLTKKGKGEGSYSMVDLVGEWSARWKELGQKLNITTMVLSQLNRNPENRNKSETPGPPGLEALRNSGEIEQNADVVLMLYKCPGMDERLFSCDADWRMDISVEKHRNGPTGTIPTVFIRSTQEWVGEYEYELFQQEGRRPD